MFVGGDPDLGLLWLRTAAALDPEYDYVANEVAEDHPVISGWKLARLEVMEAEPPVPLDRALGEGEHYLDGALIETAVAAADQRHVYQQTGDELRTWLIDGDAFPEEAFGTVVAPDPVAPEPTDPVIDGPVVVKSNNWPAQRVAVLGAGVASLGASAAMYGLASSSRSQFDTASTVADLDRHRASTNRYVIGSGIAGAAGAGLVGFGVLFFVVDGDPRPTLDFHF